MHLVLYTLRGTNGEDYADPCSYKNCLDLAREAWDRGYFKEIAGIYYGLVCITSAHELGWDFDEEWHYRQEEA